MHRRHPVPAEVYALVEQTPAAVLLEGSGSNPAQAGEAPWTQLFLAPSQICVAHTPAEIPALFAAVEAAAATGQFAAGFFTYECGNAFEPKAQLHPPRDGQPLAWIGVYPRRYVFNDSTGTFVGGEPPELAGFRARQRAAAAPDSHEPEAEVKAEFALDEAEYAERIAAIHEWIRAGDVYQLNFTAPFRIGMQGGAAAHYARLRARQPVAYGAFLHWREGEYILSFSPELFFRVEGDGERRRIVTRPMKGTAARGRTTREDHAIAGWLQNDAKNRSENLMIVDLLRNDLGRIAHFGSVQAGNLFAVERYPTLWQMTSTIKAELRADADFYAVFRALFPCGSITGAPKVRAMQLLAELEGRPRGIYTGAIGFFSREQSIFNVAIRTLQWKGSEGTFGVGSGVVIDSDPAQEYRECLLKASFLTGPAHRTANPFLVREPDKLFLIESLLWNGAYPFLELHLDRLADSAEYFGFACDRSAVRAALEQHAQQFADTNPRKVRLLLVDADGNLQIGSEPLAVRDATSIGRVCVATQRTNPADATLYHKTTQRAIYAMEHLRARERGFDDALFLNLRGEVTEGAISNLFIEKDGCWLTPPVDCGLLAGVYRRHLLETRPEIAERVLSLHDLLSANAVYITNAVRGLRRVEVFE